MSEIEKLKDFLAKGDFENAQDLILILEEKLEEEKSKYSQKILKEKIDMYKQMYSDSLSSTNLDIEKMKCEITNNDSQTECVIENKSNCTISLDKKSQLVFRNCDFTVLIAECDTAFIRNCTNCKFELVVDQLRLFGCENVELKVYTKTGVYIEECKNITVEKLNDWENNLYDEVHDFSCPFEKINYKII